MDLRRGVDPVFLSALRQTSFPVVFVWLDWPDAPVRTHSGVGDIEWGGQIWRGVGGLGGIEIPSESQGIVASEAVLSLAGVSSDIEGYMDDRIRGRAAEIYVGSLRERPGGYDGEQPGVLVGTPHQIFFGLMDTFRVAVASADGGGVEYEARVGIVTGVEARTQSSVYHTDENQRSRYPSDTAGRHVIMALANAQKLTWPEN